MLVSSDNESPRSKDQRLISPTKGAAGAGQQDEANGGTNWYSYMSRFT